MARVELRKESFFPYRELEGFQASLVELAGKYGATASFVGTMRDFNEDETVLRMSLEYYPGMTERSLEQIVAEARSRFEFIDALVIHRVGPIQPNEPIVLVAVWSVHRGTAFDACRHIMEELKTKAPFWKKEKLIERERWVEHNTRGY